MLDYLILQGSPYVLICKHSIGSSEEGADGCGSFLLSPPSPATLSNHKKEPHGFEGAILKWGKGGTSSSSRDAKTLEVGEGNFVPFPLLSAAPLPTVWLSQLGPTQLSCVVKGEGMTRERSAVLENMDCWIQPNSF